VSDSRVYLSGCPQRVRSVFSVESGRPADSKRCLLAVAIQQRDDHLTVVLFRGRVHDELSLTRNFRSMAFLATLAILPLRLSCDVDETPADFLALLPARGSRPRICVRASTAI